MIFDVTLTCGDQVTILFISVNFDINLVFKIVNIDNDDDNKCDPIVLNCDCEISKLKNTQNQRLMRMLGLRI